VVTRHGDSSQKLVYNTMVSATVFLSFSSRDAALAIALREAGLILSLKMGLVVAFAALSPAAP